MGELFDWFVCLVSLHGNPSNCSLSVCQMSSRCSLLSKSSSLSFMDCFVGSLPERSLLNREVRSR